MNSELIRWYCLAIMILVLLFKINALSTKLDGNFPERHYHYHADGAPLWDVQVNPGASVIVKSKDDISDPP